MDNEKLIIIACACVFFSVQAQGESEKSGSMNRHPVIGGNKILDLDFSRKTPEKGWKLRENARLTGGGLSVLNDNIRKPDGLLLRGIPELTPENAFQIMADVVLDSRYKRSNVPAMIYDSKYVAKPGKDFPYHKGFMFYLKRLPLRNT